MAIWTLTAGVVRPAERDHADVVREHQRARDGGSLDVRPRAARSATSYGRSGRTHEVVVEPCPAAEPRCRAPTVRAPA